MSKKAVLSYVVDRNTGLWKALSGCSASQQEISGSQVLNYETLVVRASCPLYMYLITLESAVVINHNIPDFLDKAGI